MMYMLPDDAGIDLPECGAIPAHLYQGTIRDSAVAVSLDIRSPHIAKVIDTRLIGSADEVTGVYVDCESARSKCLGTLAFVVLGHNRMRAWEAYDLSVRMVPPSRDYDIWASIRYRHHHVSVENTTVIEVAGEEFVGFTSDVELIPGSPGVLIIGDRIAGTVTPIAVEVTCPHYMGSAVADLTILGKYKDRFFGEPVFAYCELDGEDDIVCQKVAESTKQALRKWGVVS